MSRTSTAVTGLLLVLASALPAMGDESMDELLGRGEDWQVAVDGLGFADGLSYDADGNVFFADLRGAGAGVYKLSPDGTKIKLISGGRSGTRVGPDGKLYASVLPPQA
jgi:gluconolactonase